jgi:cell fate (sporulation/competence/biofilm development) regulator YlbF (YheA/YmcA/DUF963 family)
MNILILTPDRVGSTLLQRLVTVYANINENHDPLTVNLHELTNGIASYHNKTFNRTVLGKKEGHWGYHQSLETVVNLLKTCGHDVTSRLAHYHIKNRKDTLSSQLDFYKYLNKNFYIIAAKRKNLFEHVMSWCISVESKKLNVYSSEEKFNTFKHMQQHGITVQAENIEKYLNQYQEYLTWIDNHFQVNSYFEYDRDLPNIEDFILNLNIFNSIARPLTWQDRFDISWNDWNRMHYLLSLVPFDNVFSAEENDFIAQHIETYSQSRIELQDLQDQGVLVSGIPIKLHTLTEKAKLIRNIDQCLEYYNNWIGVNQPTFAVPYNPDTLNNIAQLEYNKWNSIDRNLTITVPSKLILQADLKFS